MADVDIVSVDLFEASDDLCLAVELVGEVKFLNDFLGNKIINLSVIPLFFASRVEVYCGEIRGEMRKFRIHTEQGDNENVETNQFTFDSSYFPEVLLKISPISVNMIYDLICYSIS